MEIHTDNSERVDKEAERLRRRYAAMYMVERVVVRGLRIIVGIVIALFALKGCEMAFDIASVPFAALTILKLVGFLGLAVLTIYGFFFAFSTAFGESPSGIEFEDKLREKAQRSILAQDSRTALDEVLSRHSEPQRNAWLMKLATKAGRFVGKLSRRIRGR